MEIVKEIILGIYNAGAAVFLPLVFFIVGLFFRMKPTNALRAGLKAGIGLAGVSLITNYLITTLTPVIEYYAKTSSGARFDIVDVPWSVSAALPFALPISVFFNSMFCCTDCSAGAFQGIPYIAAFYMGLWSAADSDRVYLCIIRKYDTGRYLWYF